mmetsp:Transcript_50105/g.119232  ORF Transcript_50105/g.119232 Transcript_50105/m.119232 type:complete len:1039 (+) Transcript_50105:151-3267(+)
MESSSQLFAVHRTWEVLRDFDHQQQLQSPESPPAAAGIKRNPEAWDIFVTVAIVLFAVLVFVPAFLLRWFQHRRGSNLQAQATPRARAHVQPTLMTSEEEMVAEASCNVTSASGTLHEAVLARVISDAESAAVLIPQHEETGVFTWGSSRLLSFAELARWSACIAKSLLEAGYAEPGLGSIIGIGAEGHAMIPAIMAAWRTRSAYTPLPPTVPVQRLQVILEDTRTRVVLADEPSAARCQEAIGNIQGINLEMLPTWEEVQALEQGPKAGAVLDSGTQDDICYLLYTSGSTGRPKGVRAPHRAVSNRFQWMWDTYPFTKQERCLAWTSTAFVDHLWELFGCLGAGTPLVFAHHMQLKRFPARAVEVVRQYGITRLVMVPSLLRELVSAAAVQGAVENSLNSLKLLTLSGEALPIELLRSCLDMLSAHTTILNIYGSTEVAADVTCAEFRRGRELAPGPLAPVGVEIPGVTIHVLDPSTLAVADGQVGEFFVSGVCLAEGYLNRPEEEAERFVTLPWGVRAFRTGDFGYRDAVHGLYYTGRQDQQVKVNGQRVEVLEVEQALLAVLAPRGAHGAVVAVAGDSVGSRLVAFISPPVDAVQVQAAMIEKLPEAWVPSAFHGVDEMPLLPTGKLNRQELSRRAEEAGAVRVLDSFGRMRRLNEDIATALSLMRCAYCCAIANVILSHWNLGKTPHRPDWVFQSLVIARDHFWMVVFYFGYGLTESLAASDGRLKPSLVDVFLVVLLAGWPSVVISFFGTLAWLLGSPHYNHDHGLRWYVVWMLYAKYLMMLLQLVMHRIGWWSSRRKTVTLTQTAVFVILSCLVAGLTTNTWPLLPMHFPPSTFLLTMAPATLGSGLGTEACALVVASVPSRQPFRLLTQALAGLLAVTPWGILFAGEGDSSADFGITPFGAPLQLAEALVRLACLAVALSSCPRFLDEIGSCTLLAYVIHESFAPLFVESGFSIAGVRIFPSAAATTASLERQFTSTWTAFCFFLAEVVIVYAYVFAFLAAIAWPLWQIFLKVTAASWQVVTIYMLLWNGV